MKAQVSLRTYAGSGRLLAVLLLTIGGSQAASAASGGSSSNSGQSSGSGSDEDTGNDDLSPERLFHVYDRYETAPGSGLAKGSIATVTTNDLELRYVDKIDLDPEWRLGLRVDLPLLATNPVSSSNPRGAFLYGLGDADFQSLLVHDFNQTWRTGFGVRIIAPTGGNLGDDEWRIMGRLAVRYSFSSSNYVQPEFVYDQSFAGPGKQNISDFRFSPTVNWKLGDNWFVTAYPDQDIRINFGDRVAGQTGRLFLPIEASLGRKFADNITATLALGVPLIRDYPVYDYKVKANLNWQF